jgi:hypothetical protein
MGVFGENLRKVTIIKNPFFTGCPGLFGPPSFPLKSKFIQVNYPLNETPPVSLPIVFCFPSFGSAKNSDPGQKGFN